MEIIRLLASEVITGNPFEPIREEPLEQGKKRMEQCEKVLLCDFPTGAGKRRLEELIRAAGAKLVCLSR